MSGNLLKLKRLLVSVCGRLPLAEDVRTPAAARNDEIQKNPTEKRGFVIRWLSTGRANCKSLVKQLLYGHGAGAIVLFSLLTYAAFYRAVLYYRLVRLPQDKLGPMGFLPEVSSRVALLGALASDAKYILLIGALVWATLAAAHAVLPARLNATRHVLAASVIGGTIVGVVLIYVAHQAVLWQLGAGLTARLVTYGLGGSGHVQEYLSYMTSIDWLLLLVPIPIVGFYYLGPPRAQAAVRLVVLGLCVISVPCRQLDKSQNRVLKKLTSEVVQSGTALTVQRRPVAREITMSPVGYMVGSRGASRGRLIRESRATVVSPAQARSPKFIVPLLTGEVRPAVLPKPHLMAANVPVNVVLIQMEGVSQTYAMRSGYMPFLNSIESQTCVFDRHYSSGVDTDNAVFSLFTGLFPPTDAIEFDERGDLRLPTLFTFLPGRRHSFLVTGSGLRLWYPVALLENTGLKTVVDARNSTAAIHEVLYWKERDEDGTATIVSDLIQASGEPFVGVYYPYATHWPYNVFGEVNRGIAAGDKLARYV